MVYFSITCRYLSHMLPNETAMDQLSLLLPNQQAYLIQAWFRCVWQVLPPSDQMQELTRLILFPFMLPVLMCRLPICLAETFFNNWNTKFCKFESWIPDLKVCRFRNIKFERDCYFQYFIISIVWSLLIKWHHGCLWWVHHLNHTDTGNVFKG